MKKSPTSEITNVITCLRDQYGIEGQLTHMVGDVDQNFRCLSDKLSFTVKLTKIKDLNPFNFEFELLNHLAQNQHHKLALPVVILNHDNQWITVTDEQHAHLTVIRVLSWIEGALWSHIQPHSTKLLYSLGQQAARLDLSLADFTHPASERLLKWDLAQCLWIKNHFNLFSEQEINTIKHFIHLFEQHQSSYQQLRKQVIHNDMNDNNIIVDIDNIGDAQVVGFIDFGDAICSQLINEVAIACAYGIMHKADPLQAAAEVVAGYHTIMALHPEELQQLYHLIGIRLAISVTQSALAKSQQPDNPYKNISEKPAWDLLHQWHSIQADFAHYHFRLACGLMAHPKEKSLVKHLQKTNSSLTALFPEHTQKQAVHVVDLSVSSTLLGSAADYEDHDGQSFKIQQLQKQYPNHFLAGGYREARSFYASDAFSIEGNNGKTYRTIHLGLDIWLPAHTAVHAPLSGRVVALHNNDFKRDYGPTIILSHNYTTEQGDAEIFYTLYGHLSKQTLSLHQLGDEVTVGQLLAWTGKPHENGGWSAHLHFQIMHDLLGNHHDFPGACTPGHLPVMQSICPNPKHLFKYNESNQTIIHKNETLINYRQQHLGKSLSLSYSRPIQILRGDDVYLIDQLGQKYLDTCNNVAHVGHEHPVVVKAGQAQMAVLNTNSRYLHPAIINFTESLLATLPHELSVVHLVNSGTEANELALRMAKAYSGGKDIIALASGYHGNSNACIDISSYKFAGKGGQGAPKNTHIVPLPDSFRGRHQGANSASQYAQYVDEVILKLTQNGKQLSAFIAETIVSCGGQIELPTGYLAHVYQAVRKAGGVCIADEVQVGCGRIGSHFWAFETHQVVPDILTIGKPIGNGHPLAAVVCTRAVADRFANGMEYFNTFGGNPVSATIGHAVLDVIQTQQLQHNALLTGNYLKQALTQLMQQHSLIKDVRGQGLFLGFELCDDQLKPLAQQANYLANRMRDFGILISTDGPEHNVIKIKPPITFKTQHADELLERLQTILIETPMNKSSLS